MLQQTEELIDCISCIYLDGNETVVLFLSVCTFSFISVLFIKI